jgi:nanoRNase/pAp phosphatase (c-di-AMP/oligoRNAs hydrolase)
MVLIELANANPKSALDISAEQERAHGLVSETRLYRQTAEHTGDAAVAGVLDEMERVLLDITHEPSRLSPRELEKLRERLKAEGILFKIRVLGSNVRREEEPAEPAPRKL